MSDVRAHSGVPVTAQFAGLTTPSACAPIVVDSATGIIYSLKTGDIVTAAVSVGVASEVTVADEATDATCFPLFVTAATGDLAPKSNAALTFDASTGVLGSTNISAWTSFVASRTGWTDVGAPTVTAFTCRVGDVMFFAVRIVPATTTATTAGTSYIDLPSTASGIGGSATMVDRTSNIAVGTCVIDAANDRCYVPTQVATGDTLYVAGWYEL